MNTEEAKFILAAYRPDGRDAVDPQFTAALALAAQDPVLRAWWERQVAFDLEVTRKIAAIAPPASLRASILAGARLSRPRVPVWRRPAWLAVAASVTVFLAAAATWRALRPAPTRAELAAQSIADLVHAHHAHAGAPPGGAGWQERLAGIALPLPQTLTLDLAELRRRRCRTLQVGGREVFEFCFERDGAWFPLRRPAHGFPRARRGAAGRGHGSRRLCGGHVVRRGQRLHARDRSGV